MIKKYSLALENMRSYQHRQRVENIKVVAEMVAELLTAVSIAVLAVLWFGIL